MSQNICKAFMEKIILPTYEVGKEEKIPQFMDKRVYQGSSGKVYPYPVIENISNTKVDKEYKALFLENDYLKIMILPELGGRIHRAWDKIGNRDFVYYNQTIKPALVGLLGPWISGGIEFNWPQHHRPTTFMPVDWYIKESADKATIYISELEKMSGQRVLAEFSLYKDSAYLEIKARLYNTSNLPQTFLWWANPAVKAGDYHQSIFPPDVKFVCDHGKRDISRFPIATGVYYKYDYKAGVDISRYKNIPVPTSYMAWKSNYDFVGVYEHDEKAGLMHVADRHIVPGKKQWTWGNADFGKAWDDNLTDSDGPYIELMTGAFTDNQPDFSWLEPYEEKTFTQYFMPYRNLGVIHNANKDILIKCNILEDNINIGAFVTKDIICKAILTYKGIIVFEKDLSLKAGESFEESISNKAGIKEIEYYSFNIYDKLGKVIISYNPEKEKIESLPNPATAPLEPEFVQHNEELYYIGLHIEQYRYATSTPEKYWLEAIKRDSLDYRCNMAMGRLYLRRGNFFSAIEYLKNALKRITMKNANPESGEVYFLLGLCYEYIEDFDNSYTHYYKSIWNGSFRDKGFFALTRLALRKNDIVKAREFLNLSLSHNLLNHKARHLDIILLRLEKSDEIVNAINKYLEDDPLSFAMLYEKYIVEGGKESLNLFKDKIRDNSENYIELSVLYLSCGLLNDALAVLSLLTKSSNPIFYFYKAYIFDKVNDTKSANEALEEAFKIKETTVFPNRLEDIKPLEYAIKNRSSIASYLLGCFYYDKKQYKKSKELWEYSLSLKDDALVNRCLSIYFYNQEHDYKKSIVCLDKALDIDKSENSTDLSKLEARYLFERDQLAKKLNENPNKRIERLDKSFALAEKRDDLYIEWISLLNMSGEYRKAYNAMKQRIFHPWEGGEGKVTTQWILSHLYIGISLIKDNKKEEAYSMFESARSYPRNLGEGKLPGATDNDIMYWLAKTRAKDEADKLFNLASLGTEEVGSMIYYNDYPADYIFWQGMSLLEINNKPQAYKKFYTLIDYAERHMNDNPKIDFLSVSIPDFLIFEEDLIKKNKVHCYFLLAMGYYGLGDKEKATQYFNNVLELDSNHIKANFITYCIREKAI